MEDTIMKKTYINPEMNVIKIATQQMLAGSSLGISGSTGNTSDLLSRESDCDDWED